MRAAFALLLILTAPLRAAEGVDTPVQRWDHRLAQLREAVWRSDGMSVLGIRDERGRTIRDDLNEWLLAPTLLARWAQVRAEAQQRIEAGQDAAAADVFAPELPVIDAEERRLQVIQGYWSGRLMLDGLRERWLPWLARVPAVTAEGSRTRVARAQHAWLDAYGPGADPALLAAAFDRFAEQYNAERNLLAGLVTSRAFQAGQPVAQRDLTSRCRNSEPAADLPRRDGDHGLLPGGIPDLDRYFPDSSRRQLLSGRIEVYVAIDARGCVLQLQVASSSGVDELDAAALDAAEHARLGAAVEHGEPVPAKGILPVRFVLRSTPDGSAPLLVPIRASEFADQAERALRVDDLAHASEALADALSIEPLNVGWRLRRAWVLRRQGDRAGSELELTAAEAAGTHEPRVPIARSQMALFDGDLRTALSASAQAVALDQTNIEALESHAWVERRLGRDAEALADAQRIVQLRPTLAHAYVLRSYMRGGSQSAVRLADLNEALAQERGSIEAHYELATYWRDQGDLAAALSELDTLAAAREPAVEVLAARAALHWRRGERAQASEDVARVIDGGNTPARLNALCYVLATWRGELPVALQACEAAVGGSSHNAPDSQAAYADSDGFVLLALGRYAEALPAFDRALALHPHSADSLYCRGITRLRLSQRRAANRDLDDARAIDARVAERMASYGVAP